MTTGGEGGAIITDDDALAERLRRIRHHGEGPIEGERAYYHLELGYNYRMTSMQAATGLVQLQQLDEYLDARRRNAAYLTERLGEIDGVEPPFVAEYAVHSYYKYICRLRPETGIDIERFVAAVAAEGVPDLAAVPDAAAAAAGVPRLGSAASPARSPSGWRASCSRCWCTRRWGRGPG